MSTVTPVVAYTHGKETIMSMESDLRSKMKNNQCEIFITEADDLLAAWKFKRLSSPKRSKNLNMVPTQLRCTHPSSKPNQLIPCHVSIRRKAGQTFTEVTPPAEYATKFCHGHGRIRKISAPDLDSLEAITFTKINIAPYVSPVLDTGTLALVAKDLGITGKAIPKMIKGRQYIAFANTTGFRTYFPRTIYAANSTKIINMAIGALGIGKMVAKGALITLVLTVPLTVAERFLQDQTTWYQLAGSIGADLIKVGVPALMAGIASLLTSKAITIAVWPIAVAIGIGFVAGMTLDVLDAKYKFTEKLIVALKDMEVEGQKAAGATGSGMWNTLRSGGLGMGGGYRKVY